MKKAECCSQDWYSTRPRYRLPLVLVFSFSKEERTEGLRVPSACSVITVVGIAVG